MNLRYKEDWEQAKERYRAWWAHEAIGRCALAVTAPRADAPDEPPPPMPADPYARWNDLGYLDAVCDWAHRRTFFGGEAFPVWHGGYPGDKQLAVFLGCPVHLDLHTGWTDPILDHEDLDLSSLRIDERNPQLQDALRLLRHAAERAKGGSIPSIGAFGGGGDTLAALRGSDRLLYDVMDRPEQVRAADLYLMDLWCELYERFYRIVRETAEGSTCWFELWAPGKFYASQNDFSYMIGPKTFRDLFLPTIERQTQFLDYAVYHVDGRGAFVHVDALCELPRLRAIQILPGAGQPSPLHFLPVLQKVQAAGRNLHLGLAAEEVRPALELLSARGLFIQTWCRTEQQARDLLKNAERWSRDRRGVSVG